MRCGSLVVYIFFSWPNKLTTGWHWWWWQCQLRGVCWHALQTWGLYDKLCVCIEITFNLVFEYAQRCVFKFGIWPEEEDVECKANVSKTVLCSISQSEDLKRIKRKRKAEGNQKKNTLQLEHRSPRILSPALFADELAYPAASDVLRNKCTTTSVYMVQVRPMSSKKNLMKVDSSL